MLERPTVLELAERLGVAGAARRRPLRPRHRRRRPGRAGGRRLRRLGGPAHGDGRARGARRPGRAVQPHRELPRLPRRPERLGPRAPRAPIQARRLGAELLSVQDAVALEVEGAGRLVALSGGGEPERELRARGLGRLLPPARRARLRALHRRRHLLRRGDDRGARRARTRPWSSSAAPTPPARPPSTSASYAGRVIMLVRADSLAKSMSHYLIEQIAALPERRGAHRLAGGRRPRATTGACARCACAAPDGAESRRGGRRRLRLHRRGAAHRLAGGRRGPRRARLHPRRRRRQGGRLAAAAATPTCWRRACPGVFVAGDVRARSIKRVASAVGEGSMAVSLIHEYLAQA